MTDNYRALQPFASSVICSEQTFALCSANKTLRSLFYALAYTGEGGVLTTLYKINVRPGKRTFFQCEQAARISHTFADTSARHYSRPIS